jgi:F-type H+-transporting ATPase subunit b
MLIDWFTVIAQVINFLVLVWLLAHFLYRPILNAIDEREKRIADELANADSKRAEAEKERDEFQQKNSEFEKHRAKNMEKVIAEAKTKKEQLLNAVREEADALRSTLELALKNEQTSLQETLNQQVTGEVFAIARKALTDLAGSRLETSMANIFVKRLGELNDEEKSSLHLAFNDSDKPLIVHTAFDLPAEQNTLIKTALHDVLGRSVEVQFTTDADVISGIEINANGQKIAWSIADYLTSLNKRVDHLIQSKQMPPSKEALQPKEALQANNKEPEL